MAFCGGCRSCCALTRKNAILKSRTPVSSAVELVLPLIFVVGMVLLSTLFSTTVNPAAAYVKSGIGNVFAPSGTAGMTGSVLPVGSLPWQLKSRGWRLAVLPAVQTNVGAVAAAASFYADACATYAAFNGSTAGFTDAALRQLYIPPLCDVITTEYADEAALFSAVRDDSYLADSSHKRIWAAIVFNKGAPSWDYSIRMNATDVPSTSAIVNTYATTYAPESTALYVSGGDSTRPGFLTLQLLVDRFIIGRNVSTSYVDSLTMVTRLGMALAPVIPVAKIQTLYTELSDTTRLSNFTAAALSWLAPELRMPQQVDLVPFPTPSYSTNVFFSRVLSTLTLLFVIAYVYPVSQLIRGLVLEKENRLREALKQMGATDAMLWASWFAVYAIMYAVLSLFVAIAGIRVFPASNKVLIFFIFFLYSLAATAWCFLVSVFFTKARTAAVLGSIIWVAAYFPFFSLQATTPTAVKLASSLLAPTALGCAIDVIATLETGGLGANADTAANQVINNWTVNSSIGILIFDIILYLALAWYLDAVLPSWAREYGVPRPWYFPFLPSYWGECCFGGRAGSGRGIPPRAGAPRIAEWGGMLSALGFRGAAGDRSESTPLAETDSRFVQLPDPQEMSMVASGRCINVSGLHKEFPSPDGVKVAVNNVDITFYEGQISCLLGHNGAGKTTVISMLTGVVPPTAGVASVFGRDIFADQEAVRRDLGVCPQHDVLWPELTVNEHLALFAALKGVAPADVAVESAKALVMVGLTEKANALVSSLSGGMKRKLSVCLAFLGGSKIVFLDEPTSGVDPYSRRSMWNILQNARRGRIIILTTHFMDEAEILGDRIAIMSGGKVKCAGTPLFLKESYGSGYTLTIVKDFKVGDSTIVDFVKAHVPDAFVSSSAGAELALRLPLKMSHVFPALLRELDSRKDALGIRSMGMSIVSVEDVFLRIASNEASEARAHHRATDVAATSAAAPDAKGPSLEIEMSPQGQRSPSPRTSVDITSQSPLVNAIPGGKDGISPRGGLEAFRLLARTEMGASEAFTKHAHAVFLKRACYARRDLRSVCCLMLVPLITLILGLALLASSRSGDQADLQLTTANFNAGGQRARNGPPVASTGIPIYPNYVPGFAFKSTTAPVQSADVVGIYNSVPTANISSDPTRADGGLLLLPSAAAAITDAYGFLTATTSATLPAYDYARMSTFLLTDQTKYAASKYGAYVFSGNGTIVPSPDLASLANATGTSTVGVFFNTTAPHGAPIFVNLYTSALLSWVNGNSAATITTRTHPLPLTAYQTTRLLAGQSFGAVTVLLITMSYIPAAFAFFICREREVSAKHQQTISGISLPAYWIANFAWDALTMVIPVCLTLLLFTLYSASDFISVSQDRLSAFTLLLLGYAGASTSFTYLETHLFKSPSSAQAAVSMLNIVLMAIVIAAFVLKLLPDSCQYVPPMRWALSIFPMYAFGDGLSNMANMAILPALNRQCDIAHGSVAASYPAYTSAYQSDIAGVAFGYLAAQTIVYFLLALAIDVVRSNLRYQRAVYKVLCCCWRSEKGAPLTSAEVDADVQREAGRLDTAIHDPTANDVIALSHLRKEYGRKVAVQDLSFGVAPGEVFGFLGINGAGKTSTLQMLSGDILPTGGAATLGGYDIVNAQASVRRLLGYCPQFDALLDLLSVTEHLQLYGRIKGITEGALPEVIEKALVDFDIVQYRYKLAGTLSGGNKRKLSVACALIGSPPIVFLDECSTGVDPVARRKIWSIISRVATSQKLCTIILTTHSMEEVEALCTRIGIMVGGRLRCLGSAQHLRSTHGAGYSVEIRMRPPTGEALRALTARIAAARNAPDDAPVAQAQLPALSNALGVPSRLELISEASSGWAIAAAFASSPESIVPAPAFISWWAGEDDAERVTREICERAFPSATVNERQGFTIKFSVPIDSVRGRSLADLYGSIEEVKARFNLESATLTQTTLEQVFNTFAAQQEEERSHARGFLGFR